VAIKNTSNKLNKFTFNVEQKSKQPPQPVGCVIIKKKKVCKLCLKTFPINKRSITSNYFLLDWGKNW
jgi:hypothetical protein